MPLCGSASAFSGCLRAHAVRPACNVIFVCAFCDYALVTLGNDQYVVAAVSLKFHELQSNPETR
jgi:hypothetical protein